MNLQRQRSTMVATVAADANDRRVCVRIFLCVHRHKEKKQRSGRTERSRAVCDIQFNNNRYYKSKVITHNQAKGRPPKKPHTHSSIILVKRLEAEERASHSQFAHTKKNTTKMILTAVWKPPMLHWEKRKQRGFGHWSESSNFRSFFEKLWTTNVQSKENGSKMRYFRYYATGIVSD